jgi:hypothetical protein
MFEKSDLLISICQNLSAHTSSCVSLSLLSSVCLSVRPSVRPSVRLSVDDRSTSRLVVSRRSSLSNVGCYRYIAGCNCRMQSSLARHRSSVVAVVVTTTVVVVVVAAVDRSPQSPPFRFASELSFELAAAVLLDYAHTLFARSEILSPTRRLSFLRAAAHPHAHSMLQIQSRLTGAGRRRLRTRQLAAAWLRWIRRPLARRVAVLGWLSTTGRRQSGGGSERHRRGGGANARAGGLQNSLAAAAAALLECARACAPARAGSACRMLRGSQSVSQPPASGSAHSVRVPPAKRPRAPPPRASATSANNADLLVGLACSLLPPPHSACCPLVRFARAAPPLRHKPRRRHRRRRRFSRGSRRRAVAPPPPRTAHQIRSLSPKIGPARAAATTGRVETGAARAALLPRNTARISLACAPSRGPGAERTVSLLHKTTTCAVRACVRAVVCVV